MPVRASCCTPPMRLPLSLAEGAMAKVGNGIGTATLQVVVDDRVARGTRVGRIRLWRDRRARRRSRPASQRMTDA